MFKERFHERIVSQTVTESQTPHVRVLQSPTATVLAYAPKAGPTSASRSFIQQFLDANSNRWRGTGKLESIAGSIGIHLLILILISLVWHSMLPLASRDTVHTIAIEFGPAYEIAAHPAPPTVVPPVAPRPPHVRTTTRRTPPAISRSIPRTPTIRDIDATRKLPDRVASSVPSIQPTPRNLAPQRTIGVPGDGSPATEFDAPTRDFSEEPFEDFWCNDHTNGTAFNLHVNGNIDNIRVDHVVQGKYYDQASMDAYIEYHRLRDWERRAIIAGRKPNESEFQNRAHEKAKASATECMNLLQKHLVWLDLPQNKTEPSQFVGDRSVSATYANMAMCSVVLGKPADALAYSNRFAITRPRGWHASYTFFGVGTLLYANGYLNEAKQLLERTVSGVKDEQWNQYNSDPQFRVITHETLAAIADDMNDGRTATAHRSKAKQLLSELPLKELTFVRDRLWQLGIKAGPELTEARNAIMHANN